MFIGREQELSFLQDRYESKAAQLVVIYGRRRVGKTETLREFCKDKPHVFYSCTECTDSIQLSKFSKVFLKENVAAKHYISEFSDWEQAFGTISELPYGEKKKLLIIDEFPYMCKNNAGIPSMLQKVWDEKLKNENIMIILCGSAMSFIEKELLAEKNPLYGRATGIYKMMEMNFYDAIQFFPNYSDTDKILAYSILGGIPHYLSQFDPDLTLGENIKKKILSKGSVLYSEVEFLLHQELRDTPVYNSIIEAVALGSTKLNDINQKSLIADTSKTSVYLKKLIELGIVGKEYSIDTKAKEKANTNRGFYRLTDNFFKFWYAFCFSNHSQLEDGDINGVYEYIIKPQLSSYASYAFEDVCKEFIKKRQRKNELPFRYSSIGKWFGKTTVRDPNSNTDFRVDETEIDILAISKSENEYLVGECKFKNKPFSYSEYLDTKAKLMSLKKDSKFYYALFSKSGFDDTVSNTTKTDANVFLYELSEIIDG